MGKSKYKSVRGFLLNEHPKIYKEVVKNNFSSMKEVKEWIKNHPFIPTIK